MKFPVVSHRAYWFAYPVWIAICAILFGLLRHSGDAGARRDHIDDERAKSIALSTLSRTDATRFARYEVVHVTSARRGEAAGEARWLVLCDRPLRSALRDAVVVELAATDGSVREIRLLDPNSAAVSVPLPLRSVR